MEKVRKRLVYLDYNLYSTFKNPTNPEHISLSEFVKSNANKIQLVYSEPHLEDLSTGKVPKLIEKDLDNTLHLQIIFV